MVVVLVILTASAFIAFDYLFRVRKQGLALQATGEGSVMLAAPPDAARDLSEVPAGLFMAPGHTWLSVDSDGQVKIGAGRLVTWTLGGALEVESLRPGTQVAVGDKLAVLRSGGREVTLRSSVEGTVAALNDRRPGAGHDLAREWLVQLQPSELPRDLARMKMGAQAVRWMRSEMVRLRDLLATTQRGAGAALTGLADGGVPVKGVAREIDGAAWEQVAEAMFAVDTPDPGRQG